MNNPIDWPKVACWLLVITFCVLTWAAIIVALWKSAGCSVSTPC